MAGKRIIPLDYDTVAISNGFLWVGDYPANTTTSTDWLCQCGHLWKAPYARMRDESRSCPGCGGGNRLPLTSDDYKAVGMNKDVLWVGEVLPKKNSIHTSWVCENGHSISRSYSAMRLGVRGCQICWREERYTTIAVDRGLTFDTIPNSIHDKITWYCENGHEIIASYFLIKTNIGCKYCLNTYNRELEDYHKLAKSRGYIFVGNKIPKDSETYVNWQCPVGHIWQTSYSRIQQGGGYCQVCNTLATDSLLVREILLVLDKNNINYDREVTFDTCRDKGILAFDFLIEDIFLLEADGQQHDTGWFNSKKSLRGIQRRDGIKNKWCIENNIQLYRIRYDDKDISEKLLDILTKENIL